jgi:hypothetical protein
MIGLVTLQCNLFCITRKSFSRHIITQFHPAFQRNDFTTGATSAVGGNKLKVKRLTTVNKRHCFTAHQQPLCFGEGLG